jgi:hypothetical protein
MPAAAYSDSEVVLSRVADRRSHVAAIEAARDHGGPAVDRAIPDASGGFVVRISWRQHSAAESWNLGCHCLPPSSGSSVALGFQAVKAKKWTMQG